MNDKPESPPVGPETCKFFISMAQPECGVKATHKVKVRTLTGQAIVPLCDEHKAQHDRAHADMRTRRKTKGVPYLSKGGRVEEI